ncbi:MAG TPA: GNAT family N-acetyltransferase [Chloroflexota bacterium]|nr:GNAT family N-acetyltransferase [Chloroflexota bacterium]
MLVRHVEELTLNAWPALNNLMYDGWVLSFSEGYTRRANSIHPLYPSTLPLADKIAACEASYAARGQQTVFKLTDSDLELDATLERLGYASAGTTSVQIADLSRLDSPVDGSVVLRSSLEADWQADFNRLSAIPDRFRATMQRMLRNIAPAHAFASISVGGQSVALGLAVAERGYVGLFDIVVDATVRNQGLGRRIVTRLLQWGRDHNATRAHLAVVLDNAPALHLYAQLGFTEAYRYWYRHKGTS